MTKFGEQFKKELEGIKTDRSLLDHTLMRIKSESERSLVPAAARKEPRRSRVVFFRTAAALAAVAFVTAGAIFFVSYLGQSGKSEKAPADAYLAEGMNDSPDSTVAANATLAVSPSEEAVTDDGSPISRDPDIVRLDSYETLLTQMRCFNLDGKRIEIAYDNVAPGIDSITAASQDYSQTNIQTSGVDEADIVKNDRSHLYYMAGDRLLIFDIRNPSEIRLKSEILITDSDFGRSGIEFYYDSMSKKLWLISYSYSHRDIPYSDDVKRSADICYMPGSITVDTYDVRDPSDPVLLSSFSQEGNYLSSRRIGDTIYLVTVKSTYGYPYDSLDVFPAVKDGENDWSTVPARDIYVVGSEYIDAFTVVSAIGGKNGDREAVTQVIAGSGSTVYASSDKLFVTGTVWESSANIFTFESNSTLSTKILSFSIIDGGLTAFGAGSVPGRMINQYSMDYRDGYLRIATTSNNEKTLQTSNNIFVLDDNLDRYSSLENLAPGETIYAVRFDGDRIYLVTFVQIDPLFVIDASDPGNLKVLGELKIPGFSNYLHPVGDHLLLGIGKATRNDGSVTTAGLKLALFDVTDPENPVEKSVLVYGVNYGYSDVEYNPKALMVYPEMNLFGLPLCFDKPAGDYGTDYVTGFLLVRIDSDEELVHEYLFENAGNNGICRGVYARDAVFVVSDTSIDSYDIETYKPLDSYRFGNAVPEIID